MQAKALERDATKEYISKLEREFHKLQLHMVQISKENYLKTELILNNSVIYDAYVDYLNNLLDEGIEDNYMSISEKDLHHQLNQYDVTDDEIEQYLAAPY
jgi:hypothetical protein